MTNNRLLEFKDRIVSKFDKEKIKNFFLKPSEFQITLYFLIITSIACFFISWVNNHMTVPLGGDYYMQEMNFIYNYYDDFHHFFKTGEFIFFDTSPTLGIDNIAGNAFYGLFNPFNLILLIFPRNSIMTLQGIEMALKLVLAGVFYYKYLGAFNFSEKSKRVGSIAFAFSGYCFSYLWFHFIDSVCFLPLVLLGIEKVISKRDPRTLLIGFFINGMVNYFFFVIFIMGGFFYAIFRLIQTWKSRTNTENYAALGVGILSFVLGIFLSALTLIPGLLLAKTMPRVSNGDSYLENIKNAKGFKELLVAIFTFPDSHTHNYVTPLLNFLFMADGCYYSNLLNVNWYDNFQASLYATTPLLLLFFVGIIYSFRKKKVSYIVGILLNLLLVLSPIGYYMFTGFSVGYARFFILPLSFMIVFDLIILENRREIAKYYLDIAFVVVILLEALSCYLMIYQVNYKPSYFTNTDYDERMYLILFSMIYLIVCYIGMRFLFYKKQLNIILPIICSLDCIVMANATIYLHGTVSLDNIAGGLNNVNEETKLVELLKECQDDNEYYRIYNTSADRNNNNISMKEGYNGVASFHSIYPYESQDFLDNSKIPYTYHNWSMGIHNHRMNLETYVGVKYYIVPKVEVVDKPNTIYASNYNIPIGYKNVKNMSDEELEKLNVRNTASLKEFLNSKDCNKDLYINTNYIDTFFVYDQILPSSFLKSYYYEDLNEYSYLRACALDDEDFLKFARNNQFNYSSIAYNGKRINFNFESLDPIEDNVYTYKNGLTTRNYIKGNSAPIEVYNSMNSKVTVYSAQWPSTTSNPSGDYAYCDVNKPYDESCKASWMKEHPFEFANQIAPADIKFDYDTLKDDSGRTHNEGVLYNSKLVIEKKDGSSFCDDNDENGYYISIKSIDNIEWRLFDEENKLLAIDSPSYAEYKTAHGFYVNRPVKKIVGIYHQGSKDKPNEINYSHRPELYIQRGSDYLEAINKLKENQVIIKSRNNTTTSIETSYSKRKIISTNYPYSSAFKVYEKKTTRSTGVEKEVLEEVDTYRSQGGFVSFVAETGKREYVIIYQTPGFKMSAILEITGLLAAFVIFLYFIIKEKPLDTNKYLMSYIANEKLKEDYYKYLNFEDKKF